MCEWPLWPEMLVLVCRPSLTTRDGVLVNVLRPRLPRIRLGSNGIAVSHGCMYRVLSNSYELELGVGSRLGVKVVAGVGVGKGVGVEY